MTHKLVKMDVELEIAGPVLTAGSSVAAWGLDVFFYRDWKGGYAIPGSLIRGKLKEAIGDISSIDGRNGEQVLLFGQESGDEGNNVNSYYPRRGILKLNDFSYVGFEDTENSNKMKTRIRIGNELGTVERGALIVLENPFASGEPTKWIGSVEFFCSQKQQEDLVECLKKAFVFVPTIGAEKTVGYGRLMKANFKPPEIKTVQTVKPGADAHDCLKLSIAPQEPLIIGGIRQSDNIFESEPTIPGAVIKGAFAAGLNRIAGNPDLSAPIDAQNDPVSVLYPKLAEHFSSLIFLHAVPSQDKVGRAETIPLSGVSYDNQYEDIAFKQSADVYAKGSSPVNFQLDWKNLPEGLPEIYCTPKLEFHQVTRTAIDEELRRADESRLYSFSMIKPGTEKKKDPIGKTGKEYQQVYWNSEIVFPSDMDDVERAAVSAEIRGSLDLALRYLGKRQSIVSAQTAPSVRSKPNLSESDSQFAIVLQTPALMINPADLAEESGGVFDDCNTIKTHYENFWQGLFGNTAELTNYYARQELQGGYLGMRFMTAGHYRPFFLTSKGSTFVFSVKDRQVGDKVQALAASGLPLPLWAANGHKSNCWKDNPFVPENGYGEIKVKFNR